MKLGIVITTYYRPDGRTRQYLIRALTSIKQQTHRDYLVYVMGDAYSNPKEFTELSMMFPGFQFINLPHAVERSKYAFGTMQLWCAGGVTAAVVGINLALSHGVKYICHLDHDDWWSEEHLARINQVIEERDAFFVCTMSTWIDEILPKISPIGNIVDDFYPLPRGIICSSTCVKYADTLLRPRDVFAVTGRAEPADLDLWERLTVQMKTEGWHGYVYAGLTCHHDEEGYTLRCRPLKHQFLK